MPIEKRDGLLNRFLIDKGHDVGLFLERKEFASNAFVFQSLPHSKRKSDRNQSIRFAVEEEHGRIILGDMMNR